MILAAYTELRLAHPIEAGTRLPWQLPLTGKNRTPPPEVEAHLPQLGTGASYAVAAALMD